MSLENDLGRIATALEDLVKILVITKEVPIHTTKKQAAAKPAAPKPPVDLTAAPATPAMAPNPPAQPASAPLQAPSSPAAPDTTASAAAPTANLTAEDVNAAMVVEATRLGSPDAIRAVMADFGVASVNELPAEKYQWIIDAVRAL